MSFTTPPEPQPVRQPAGPLRFVPDLGQGEAWVEPVAHGWSGEFPPEPPFEAPHRRQLVPAAEQGGQENLTDLPYGPWFDLIRRDPRDDASPAQRREGNTDVNC